MLPKLVWRLRSFPSFVRKWTEIFSHGLPLCYYWRSRARINAIGNSITSGAVNGSVAQRSLIQNNYVLVIYVPLRSEGALSAGRAWRGIYTYAVMYRRGSGTLFATGSVTVLYLPCASVPNRSFSAYVSVLWWTFQAVQAIRMEPFLCNFCQRRSLEECDENAL